MYFLNISKKYHLKLTYKPPFLDPEEIVIGQLWEFADPGAKEPHWFQFVPKYLKDIDYRLPEDGRENKTELLESVKAKAHLLKRKGLIPYNANMTFSMLAVEQTF